jgi:hypothetical protein
MTVSFSSFKDQYANDFARSQLDTDINRRIVHVVLNSLAKHEREPAIDF